MPKSRILMLSLIIFAISISLFGIWQAAAQDDLTILTFDEPINHTITNGAVDRWAIEGNRNDVIQLTITRREGDIIPQLTLLGRNDLLQARLAGSRSSRETTFVFRLPEFGRYTLEITTLDGTSGTYDLEMALLEAGFRDFEQGRLAYGQTVVQRITDEVPYHVWTFVGKAGEALDLRMSTTRGDLIPVLTLSSPGDDVIAIEQGSIEKQEVRLLAVRLPGDGTYRIFARRSGNNLGFSGTTEGTYELELTLRNGTDATANSLEPNINAPGRITADSPLVRYAVSQPGIFAVSIELSEPNCLVDLTLMRDGALQLDRFVGISPFVYPIEIPPVLNPILEVAVANCPQTNQINFNILLTPLNTTLPIQRIINQRPIYSNGTSDRERWFFEAEADDLVKITVNKDSAAAESRIVILAPDNTHLYNGGFSQNIQQTLLLEQSGLYIIEITPNGVAYTLQRERIGHNGVFYASQTPVWEETLDIASPQSWQFIVDSETPATLLIEDPQGTRIITAVSTQLRGPRIESIELKQAGRYAIKVFSDAPPQAVTYFPVIGSQINPGDTVKGTLTDRLKTNRWLMPVTAGNRLDLTLEVLTPNAPLPSISLLDQSGIRIQSQTQLIEEKRIQLIGINPDANEIYSLLVSSNDGEERTDYRLSAVFQTTIDNASELTITNTTTPEGFLESAIQPTNSYLSPLLPTDPTLFEAARRLNITSSTRAEILPEQVRQFWTINVGRGQMLSVKTTSLESKAAPGITLLDANRTVLIERWERDKPTNQIFYRAVTGGQYYLVTTLDQQGGRYLLETQTLPTLDETVPTVKDWIPIAVGSEHVADFSQRRETTTFTFWGTRGEVVSISTAREIGNLVPSFEVFDPDGESISEAAYDNTTYVAQTGELRLEDTGLFTIVALANSIDRTTANYGRYRLLVSRIRGPATDNGLLETSVTGNIGLGQGENIWIFRGTAGEMVTLQAEPLRTASTSPIILTLADSEGSPFLVENTELTVNAVSLQNVTLPRTGIYQVKVNGGTQFAGGYRLSIQRDNHYLVYNELAVVYGDTVGGVFTPTNLVDRWVVAGNRGDVIAIALRPTRGDFTHVGFQLETLDGQIIRAGADRETNAGAREENILLPETGIYNLFVGAVNSGFNGSLAYELSVERQNQQGSRSYGTLIPYDTTYEGTLFADDPVDIWLFEGRANDTISITVAGDGVLEPALALVTFETNATTETNALLSRTGTRTEPARLIQFVLPQTGAYGLRVTGVRSTTGHYTVVVNKQRDTILAPQLLEAGKTYEDAISKSEIRLWQFTGQEGDTISLTLTVPVRSSLLPKASLHAPDGKTILLVEDQFNGEMLEIAPYSLPFSGIYTLQIETLLEGEINDGGNYILAFNQEPTTTAPRIRPLAYSTPGLSTLSEDNRADLWTFEGLAGDVVHLVGEATSGNLDTTLTVTNAEGTTIASADDSPNSLNAEILMVLPESGAYTIEIAPFGRNQAGVTAGNYRLTVTLEYRPSTIPADENRLITYGDHIVDTFDPITAPTPETIDWYFIGQRGDEIEVTLQFPANETPLLLFLEDGADNRYRQGERIQDRAVIRDFVLPSDGIYRLIIERPRDSRIDLYYPYTLSLDLRTSQGEDAAAGGFLTRGISQGARFDSNHRTHSWIYSGHINEVISISLFKTSGQTYPSLVVFAPDNRIIFSQTAEETASAQNVSLALPSDGFYQIVVINDHLEPFLSYRIAVNSGEVQNLAGRLELDTVDFGALSDAIGKEVWTVEGRAGTPLYARIGITSGNLNLAVQLQTPDGAVLAIGQYNPTLQLVILPETILPYTGEYQLVVSRAGGALDGTAGTYRIRASNHSTISETLFADPLTPGQPINNFITSSNQHTYYSFSGDPNTPVSIGITVVDGDEAPSFQIMTDQGETVAAAQGFIENFYPPQNGLYIIDVTHPVPVGYSLIYQPKPNTSSTNAAIIQLRRSVNFPGRLTPSKPDDLWAFEAEAGDVLAIKVSDFSRPVRNDLIIFDPAGVPIATGIEAEGETEVIISPILIGRSGTYTLRVGAWLGDTSLNGNQYIVRIDPLTGEDIIGTTGGVISLPGRIVRGALTPDDGLDEWTFDTQAGITLSITLQTNTTRDVDLTLRDAEGAILDIDRYVTRDQEALRIRNLPITAPGVYGITVQSDAAEPVIYSLRITEETSSFQDRLANATSMAVGDTVNGSTETTPAWVFYGRSGESIIITTDSDAALQLLMIDPEGMPIASGEQVITPVVLLKDGFYGIVITAETPSAYELTADYAHPRTQWRWSLNLGDAARATLSPGAPLHEWELAEYGTGEYQIIVRPTSLGWQAQTFILDANNRVLYTGEVQPDGSTVITTYLDKNDSQIYTLLVTGEQGTYDIVFDVSLNTQSPETLEPGVIVTGRINSIDTADEWLWKHETTENLFTIHVERTQGDFGLQVNLYAPGNLFLQQFAADENGEIIAENILLPIEGTYIVQVTRSDASLSSAEGIYELMVSTTPAP